MEASALRAPAGLTRLALPSALLRLRSDEQLVAAFRLGNDDAFRIIHDRYRARLFAYTRQMLGGSRSDAEDALQDVFLRAYNALRMDERPVVLKAWLYRVAHNRCIDHLRRPTPPAAEVFEVSRTPLPDPLAEAERREDLRRLVADVQRLPEQQRSALLMRELEGLSYADLAVALETTVPAVKSLLVRARIGLVEAAEARDTACADIRSDLALSYGKGVRASALARRHMRECQSCREYRRALRTVQTGLTALTPPAHPLSLVAKLLGIGGASGGAAAGGSAAAGGGAAVVGGGVVAGTTAKVAAVVCCAAITAGGAVELKRSTSAKHGQRPAAALRSAGALTPAATFHAAARAVIAERTASASVATAATAKLAAIEAAREREAAAVPAGEEPISPHIAEDDPALMTTNEAMAAESAAATGGTMAPEEPTPATTDPAATTEPAGTEAQTAPPRAEGTTGGEDSAAAPATGSAEATATSSSTAPTATAAAAP